MIDGILIVDKPAGPTSHDVVSEVKRILGAKKVGHLGTLDPDATGVLPLCINGATKQARMLSGGEKIYSFTLVLGKITDTDDSKGKVIAEHTVEPHHLYKLETTVDHFIGEIDQIPPQYSAKRVKGRRFYKMARRGVKVDAEPKRVWVHELTIEEVGGFEVRMQMRCGPGTYVRALCRDIGQALGCGGHASDIRRIKSGRFTIDQAIRLEDVPSHWKERLIPLKHETGVMG